MPRQTTDSTIRDVQSGRPLDDTVATTGPGLPDDALAPGETLDEVLPTDAGEASPDALRERVFGDVADPDEPEAHPS